MTHSLKGKVALVTGGSRGIGAAIAKRLAAEGADVAFSYSQSAERAQAVLRSIKASGVNGLAVAADQADGAAVAALVKTVHEHFGRLDILVNSAGRGTRRRGRQAVISGHCLTLPALRPDCQ